ncbi:FAD-dependent monooxygenase [Microbulbifer aggregans]|uniref:FAD-dependent monooxygenase n=1 Tax=Microbulbifer aggregans TaxID=1769779 RepID=UPI001CFD1864|nr:FAD-dependent monooxygenase [Microbulbifer aggregans]
MSAKGCDVNAEGSDVETVDVAIVGGGMAGACLALLLSHHCPGLKVALLEKHELREPGSAIELPSFDTRATAIAAGSLQVFDQLGLWSEVRDFAAPIRRVEVSDRGHSLGVSLDAGREQRASFEGMLGAVIENAALGPALYRALSATATRILAPADVSAVVVNPAGACLSWKDGQGSEQPLQAGLLVIADGVGSPLCHSLGIETSEVHYQQRALVTTVGLQRDHGGVAFERFTDTGPMALLPLPKRDGVHRAALVWTCEEADADRVTGLPEREFIAELQKAFGWRAGRILRAGTVHGYPLKLSLAREQVRRSIALVGNCAHFLHPVAGQGFNLTLRDCDGLARTLAAHQTEIASGQLSAGELDLMQAYWRERQLDQQLTIGFSDRTPPLFAARNLFAQGLRQAGLMGLTLAPPLRSGFVRQAAGLGI